MDMSAFEPVFEELGVLCTNGTQSAYVLLDAADSTGSIGDWQTVGVGNQITYITGALSLAQDDDIVVDGQHYTVRSVHAVDDGALTVANIKPQ